MSLASKDLISVISKSQGQDEKPYRMATVSSVSGNNVYVKFNGEEEASAKPQKHLSSYNPAVGDTVIIGQINGSNVILGKIGTYSGGGGGGTTDVPGSSIPFSTPSSRSNINSGETVATVFGKIKRYFTDLKTVAFSGKYSDLDGKLELANNLTTSTAGKALDAVQGKSLKDSIDGVSGQVSGLGGQITTINGQISGLDGRLQTVEGAIIKGINVSFGQSLNAGYNEIDLSQQFPAGTNPFTAILTGAFPMETFTNAFVTPCGALDISSKHLSVYSGSTQTMVLYFTLLYT